MIHALGSEVARNPADTLSASRVKHSIGEMSSKMLEFEVQRRKRIAQQREQEQNTNGGGGMGVNVLNAFKGAKDQEERTDAAIKLSSVFNKVKNVSKIMKKHTEESKDEETKREEQGGAPNTTTDDDTCMKDEEDNQDDMSAVSEVFY